MGERRTKVSWAERKRKKLKRLEVMMEEKRELKELGEKAGLRGKNHCTLKW